MKLIIAILTFCMATSSHFANSQNECFINNLRDNVSLQFKASKNLNDTINKIDASFFVLQLGAEYDLMKRSKLFSIAPNVNGKIGFAFFLTTGAKAGFTFGINDKLKTKFPLGLQFALDYDYNLNKHKPGQRFKSVNGWCPELTLTIKTSSSSMLRISYGQTWIYKNQGNYVHNITIGASYF